MIKEITSTEFRKKMSEILNRVEYGGARYAIVRRGRVVAFLEYPLIDDEGDEDK